MRALDLASAVPWAITPEALSAILALAAREDISQEVVAAAMTDGTPEAVAARLGKPLENTRATTVRDGVAVIPISGPVFRHANLFSEISGATTTEAIARDLATALADPAVHAIVLEIDSPGGEIAGISELAQMIRAAHGQKPVTAYVDHLGASAGYWLATAAGSIVASPTALLGSIGVVMVLDDPSKTETTDLEFVSSKSPNKRPDLTTKSGKAQVQATVDALADVFIADVARYRGVSVDTVAADFGQGGVFVGQQAVDAGLADNVGSFEQTLRAAADPQQAPALIRALPATHERPAVPGKKVAMGMREKFLAWLDGVDAEASADMEAAIVTDNLHTPPPAATGTTAAAQVTAADDGEIKRLRSELQAARGESERLRMERIQSEALMFATQAISGEKAFPAEREALLAMYVQAATDDAKMGDGGNRVGLLTAVYNARPASALTREQLNPAALQILRQHETTPKAGEGPMTPERRAELMGHTTLGKSALNGAATKN